MIPPDQVMLTLARRTKVNLDYIYARKASGDVFEFTQLVNSMLSLVISMRAEYFSERKEVTWKDVFETVENLETILIDGLTKADIQIGGDTSNTDSPDLNPVATFNELINMVRNGFAHCCFEVIGDQNQEIKGLMIWNVRREEYRLEKEKRTWQAYISEAQLRAIAYLFIAYLEADRGHELAAT